MKKVLLATHGVIVSLSLFLTPFSFQLVASDTQSDKKGSPATSAAETSGGKAEVTKKLNSIVIEAVEFDKTSIESAINYLSEKSREIDPEKKGVNIIYFPPKQAPAQPIVVPSLNLRGVPLGKILEMIAKLTRLDYHVDAYGVSIGNLPSAGDVNTTYITKTFPFPPNIIRADFTPAGSGGGGGNTLKDLMEGKGGGATTTSNLPTAKEFFEKLGIDFSDKKTGILYNETHGKLIVTHTPEALEKIEEITGTFFQHR